MLNWRDPKNPKAGGAERVTEAFLRALLERGHEVFWFANAFPGCHAEEVIDGIRVARGGGQGSSIVQAMRWYRKQARFDLVIDQHHGLPWYAPWWSGTRCIAYIHEVLGPIWNAFYKWPWNSIGRTQERWTHKLYRKVPFWVPSESTRTALLRHGVRKVKVIPNGTDTFPVAALEPKTLHQPVQLIAVSRLAPNKRVAHAVAATKHLLRSGCDARLTIVGNGEDLPNLRAAAQDPELGDRVTFTGSVSEAEKNAALRRAHLLVHTSIREGWGLNVIEANAMGTPAIVYPVAGLVDSTVHNQTGLVTPAETPEALAQTIQGLLAKPGAYEQLRKAAWERSKTFLWSHVLPPACDWLESCARAESGVVQHAKNR